MRQNIPAKPLERGLPLAIKIILQRSTQYGVRWFQKSKMPELVEQECYYGHLVYNHHPDSKQQSHELRPFIYQIGLEKIQTMLLVGNGEAFANDTKAFRTHFLASKHGAS